MTRFRPAMSMLGWALNEEQNVAEYVRRAEVFLSAISDDFELILIDDGSTDRTWEIVVAALERNGWNQAAAARFLRIPRHTLIYRLEKYGITVPEKRGE